MQRIETLKHAEKHKGSLRRKRNQETIFGSSLRLIIIPLNPYSNFNVHLLQVIGLGA